MPTELRFAARMPFKSPGFSGRGLMASIEEGPADVVMWLPEVARGDPPEAAA